METVIGCTVSFVLGAASIIAARLIDPGKPQDGEQPPRPREEPTREESMKNQWESFLNYNGEAMRKE